MRPCRSECEDPALRRAQRRADPLDAPTLLPATGDMLATEAGMLSMTPEKTETSRLACQVTVSEAMDGMVVRLPEFQM